MESHPIARYTLLLVGLLLLIINHLSVLSGNPWLIPVFLRVY